MTVHDLERLGPDHHLTLPNSVVEMFSGSLGEPEGGWPERMAEVVLKGKKPMPGRPGDHLAAVDFAETEAAVEKKVGHKISRTDLLSYLMYPDVFTKFSRARSTYGTVEVLPTPEFFYGVEKGIEVPVEIEAGKTLIIKFLTVSEPQPDGTRTVFYELNGQPREVIVRDRSLQAKTESRAKADPAQPGQVGAPIPGAITSIAVEVGDQVSKGDRLMVLEAMKMQSTIYAPVAGKVTRKFVSVGEKVDSKDLLLIIE
jgi:pyruvate carboxylase